MKKLLLALSLLAFAGAAQAQVNIGGQQANSASTSGAAAGVVYAPNVAAPVIPTDNTLRNAPALGGMAGWAYAAPAGPCLGPSETKQGGAQLSVIAWGAGANYGEGQSNLDWGCVLLREMAAADSRCKAGVKQACDDLAALYEMQPGISAIRAGKMPAYAVKQVVEKPAPAAKKTAQADAPMVVAQSDPTCVKDEFIARRLNKPYCQQ